MNNDEIDWQEEPLPEKIDPMTPFIIRLQLLIMARPYFHRRDQFFDKLCWNIKSLRLSEDLECALLAVVVIAYGAKKKEREEFCYRAIDALDALYSPNNKINSREAEKAGPG